MSKRRVLDEYGVRLSMKNEIHQRSIVDEHGRSKNVVIYKYNHRDNGNIKKSDSNNNVGNIVIRKKKWYCLIL